MRGGFHPHANARALRLAASVTRIRAEFEAEMQGRGFTAAALLWSELLCHQERALDEARQQVAQDCANWFRACLGPVCGACNGKGKFLHRAGEAIWATPCSHCHGDGRDWNHEPFPEDVEYSAELVEELQRLHDREAVS